MTRRARKSKATKQIIEPNEEELNRFAGSSDEEDNVDDSLRDEGRKRRNDNIENGGDDENDDPSLDDEYNGDTEDPSEEDIKQTKDDKEKETEEESVDDEAEADVESSDDEDGDGDRPLGMANAMAKILGTGFQKAISTPVLAKTTTPLQKQAQKEKEEESKQREKRRIRKEEQTLKALHIPLSVATTRSTGGKGISTSVAKELEQERMHRRIATRGVVALFNAVAQHQNSAENEINPQAKKSAGDVKKMTKHGFLDMIKTAAKEQQETEATTTTPTHVTKENQSTTKKPQWNALQDDFMLNPKKNWDQESSSDDDNDGDNPETYDDDTPDTGPGSKKRRIQEKDGAIKAKKRGIRAK